MSEWYNGKRSVGPFGLNVERYFSGWRWWAAFGALPVASAKAGTERQAMDDADTWARSVREAMARDDGDA